LTVQLASEEIDDKNEDERRLFYVALTRARNEVTISYSTQSLEGKTQEPTMFIGEIALPYQEKVVTETFEKEFLSHKDIILTPKKIHAKTKDIYLEHTDYFAELFKRQGLNVSGLNNYLTCPWLYFFKTLLKIPEVKSVQQMLGTAVHAGLNNYITMMQKGNASLEDMLKEFNTAMRKEPFSKTDLPEYTALGESILSEYYRNKASKWTNKRESELRIYSIRFTDDIFINGTIDMIEHLPKSKDVIVYDFKTGKPKKRYEMDKADGKYANYKRQLVFYKLLLDRYHNGEMRMNTGIIEFVEPDISGTYHSEEFTITEELTTELSSIIKTVAEEIMTLSFWDKTCDDPACEFCQLRKYVL
jgi:DNA helicase-2/ATP-dependent DNA helicase PcrA